MGTSPMVTVGIPTYGNRAHFLAESVRGVLEQTFGDIEVFVSNDGSTDETPSVVASFADPRLHYVELAQPGGLHANLNRCLHIGTAPLVAICQDDDLWMPDNLARLVKVMRDHPEVGLAHGAFSWIDPKGNKLREWSAWGGWRTDTIESGEEFIHRSMAGVNRVNMSSALIRRSTLGEEVFRREDGALCDSGMWLRLALRGDVAFVEDPLTALRIHPDSASVRGGINSAELRETTILEVHLAQHVKKRFLREAGYRASEIRRHLKLSRRWARTALLRIVTRETAPTRSPTATADLLLEAARIEPSLFVSVRTWRVFLASLVGGRGRRIVRRLVGSPVR